MKTARVRHSGKRPAGEKGMTRARRDSLRNMAEVAQGWDELEDWERDEWRKRAGCIRIRIRRKMTLENLGKPRTRSMRGEELYVKINRVLEVCGYERRRLPPPPPKFGGNPVKAELGLSRVKGRLAIKLRLRGAPANDLMVFGSPPRRAGQGPGGNYAWLGRLPPPKDGESDITELYLTKLKEWRRLKDERYQVPLEGARICIRTWPQDNGWEGKGLMQISHGLVPRRGQEGRREEKGPKMG
jgi:hypothetical protein